MEFSEFKAISKEEWISKIQTDLKAKNIEDLTKEIAPGLHLFPFVHAEEVSKSYPLPTVKRDWYQGAHHTDTENASKNALILNSLNHGANAIYIEIENKAHFDLAYKDVELGFIYNDIKTPHTEINAIRKGFFNQNKAAKIYGCCHLSSYEESLELELFKHDKMHYFSIEEKSNVDLLAELTTVAKQLVHFLEKQIAPSRLNVMLQLENHLIKNIAKIRSIKLVWANLLDHFKKEQEALFVKTQTNNTLLEYAANEQLIAGANMAVAAALGGADLIYVNNGSDEEQCRLGLNIQHLLKYESHLNEVTDPLCGSFVIENLTRSIAKHVWESL